MKLRGKRALVLDLALIPLIAVYAFIYSSYNHFGVTNLGAEFYREPDHLGVGSIRMCHWGTDRFRRDAGLLHVRYRIGG